MSEQTEDIRNRPVVFQTLAEPPPLSRRRPFRVLATVTFVLAALAGATALAFGGSAVWSVVGPKAPANEPAPLWIPEPAPVGAVPNRPAVVDPDHSTGPSAPTSSDDHHRGGGSAGGTGMGSRSNSGSNSRDGLAASSAIGSVSGTGTGSGSTPGTGSVSPTGSVPTTEPAVGSDDGGSGSGRSPGGPATGSNGGGSGGGPGRH